MTSFKDLGLSSITLDAIQELGFENPTAIQKQAIPVLMEGYRDFIGLAQTGTGKTAAFGLPLIELVDLDQTVTQAVILAPTRELCQQITNQMELFSTSRDRLKVLAVFGGASIMGQIKSLKSKAPHILVATPGRLIDLLKRKAVKLADVQYLVLDEADEMLNMGFQEELDQILQFAPQEKVTWLFSATMPKEIRRMVNRYMVAPFEVRIDQDDKINANIVHQYVQVNKQNKMEALMRFLDIDPEMKAVIFTRTRLDAQNLADDLIKRKYQTDAIHGDLAQKQRDLVMDRFRSGDIPILIATDVAARGIDVNDITHVFHHTLPDDTSWYTHRSGRTARAGKKGISVVFLEQRDASRMRKFEQELKIKFDRIWIPSNEEVAHTRMDAWARKILSMRTKKVDSEILNRMQLLFANLSKDELLAKVIKSELDRLSLDSFEDLNAEFKSSHSGTRGKRSSSRKPRGRDRFSAKKSSDRGNRSKVSAKAKGERKGKRKGKGK